jgi:hypothetical protein
MAELPAGVLAPSTQGGDFLGRCGIGQAAESAEQ